MPQQILPLIPRGATQINGLVSVYRNETSWIYFLSTYPIYSHAVNDRRMFRMDALVWQRRRRPPVGRIARDLGLLSEKEIQAVLKQRATQEKFGESAIRMGYLTPYKLMVLLGKQRRFQRQIGDYFVQSGILTRRQVELMAQKQATHNQCIP